MKIILILIFVSLNIFAQNAGLEYITVSGDSLVGKVLNGEAVREVYGNVVLTQGNIIITCKKAIQFILRNDAELIGNVNVVQENLTITTEKGFYYGNLKKAETKSKVRLDDKKVILTADIGDYYFDEDRAYFQDNVKLYDTATTLTSSILNYYKDQNRAVAIGNVKIIDTENIITADTLEHYRDSRITFASNRVKITNNTNNIVIYGDHLEDYAQRKYTVINKNPVFIQVDTSYAIPQDSLSIALESDTASTMVIDTLVIKAMVMESYRDTLNIFEAKDSVEIVRGAFASKNDYTIYYKDEDKIITKKIGETSIQPKLWYENSQITGDSIVIYLRESKIWLIEINKNSFIHSQHEIYQSRFDQLSGEKIIIDFVDGAIDKTEILGSVYSIYYLYEEDTPNGLTKSSAQSAEIRFSDNLVSEVRLFGSTTSDYYPENMVEGKEATYLLPQFVLFANRPNKSNLLQFITHDMKEKIKNDSNQTKQ
jgi:lipopolysaccharide export system protein LptA